MKPVLDVVGAILQRDGKYLLGKRPAGKSQAGKWEFIGGKIESGETPQEALMRECREELALEIVVGEIRATTAHEYPDRTVRLALLDCEPAPGATPVALEHERIAWFTPAELAAIDLSPADATLLPLLLRP